MGLITGQLRSPTIQAEVPTVLYELSRNSFELFKREQPMLAQALLSYII